MTRTERSTQDPNDTIHLAGHARSIVACPSAVSMVIEGEAHRIEEDQDLALTDDGGSPTFVCRPDSPVARAAREQRSALLTVSSGLGPRGGPERDDTITMAGRLRRTGEDHCDCCQEVRHVVILELNFVLLAQPTPGAATDGPGLQHRIGLTDFRSTAHQLNRGHLQRSIEHANDCHQDELRQAVAIGTGLRPADLVGVRLADLTPSGVEIQWVDVSGAHRNVVAFPRTAQDLDELGDLLRRGLHASIC